LHPDDLRKFNAVLRYVSGDPEDGFSATAMFYRGSWNATTDQPERAIIQKLISRFGTLDPTMAAKRVLGCQRLCHQQPVDAHQ
jgi:hypothetical protein